MKTPRVPQELMEQVLARVAPFEQEVKKQVPRWAAVRDAVGFRAMELDVQAKTRELADDMTETVLRWIAGDEAFEEDASVACRAASHDRVRHGGRRETQVTLLGGKQVRLSAQYLKPNLRRERPAEHVSAKRQRNRKGRRPGIFPLLAALGIWFGVTPALAGEVCRQVSDSDSVRTGRAALERRGIRLGHERTLRIVNETAGRAVKQRNTWLRSMRTGEPIAGNLAGKRVVVALDGGRLRERVPKRRGPRRKSGHRGFDAPWREPKQLVIYVIDNRTGNVDATFAPVYDSTLGDCDAIFEMLVAYLKALGAHQASRLIVVGDGAPWIWDRADRLAKDVDLANSKLRQIVDWYHAVEKLHEIAGIPRWTDKQRDSWIRRAKNALHAGQIGRVAALIDEIAIGRSAKTISRHRDYFVRNAKRMQYASFKSQHIPCGSGAVESTVRRVVNQRLKAPGTFWLEHNAEGMLLLRSYLKAGRFDDLIDWSLLSAAPWWAPGPQPRDLTRGPLLHADRVDL